MHILRIAYDSTLSVVAINKNIQLQTLATSPKKPHNLLTSFSRFLKQDFHLWAN
jgi:hypothetical protein